MSVRDTTAAYWSLDVGDLSTSLGSGSNGLTAARAAARLAVVGPNSIDDAQQLGPLRLLWRQVESPLVCWRSLKTDQRNAVLLTEY